MNDQPRRVIDVTPTFRATADMLIALFENGTATGQDTARAELRRWGAMLDALKAEQENPLALWDVIVTERGTGERYGITFHDEATATAYAAKMTAAGYATETFHHHSAATADDAATEAIRFFTEKDSDA